MTTEGVALGSVSYRPRVLSRASPAPHDGNTAQSTLRPESLRKQNVPRRRVIRPRRQASLEIYRGARLHWPNLEEYALRLAHLPALSIPLVGVLPFFNTQQKASFEPQVWQTCVSTSFFALP